MVKFIYVLLIIINYNISESVLSGDVIMKKNMITEVKKIDTLDYLIKAITYVESTNDLKAYNPREDAVGGLQIRQTMLKDVNRILILRGDTTRFTLQDRWDYKKSKEMFKIYTDYYSIGKSFEIIAKRWNGGPNGERKINTNHYWKKVKRQLQKIQS